MILDYPGGAEGTFTHTHTHACTHVRSNVKIEQEELKTLPLKIRVTPSHATEFQKLGEAMEGSSPEPPEGAWAHRHLGFGPMKLILGLWSPKL